MKKILTTSIPLFVAVMALCQKKDSTLNPKLTSVVYVKPGKKSSNNSGSVSPYTVVGNEIRIFPSSNPQSEIHLSINKTNPQVLLLSSNTYIPNVTYQGAFWSTNSGNSWTGAETLPNNSSGRGDPSTAFDANGNGYIASMTPTPGNIDAGPIGYSIQRSTNNGATWGALTHATGDIIFDKEMIAADDIINSPFANYLYCAWMGANNFVQFNRSIDGGTNFSAPINLTNFWGQGTNVQTGVNGEVYVCYADYNGNNVLNNWTSNGLGFCSSTNGGANFSAPRRVLNYIGIRQFNMQTNDDENPNFHMIRVNDFPSMAVDKTNGNFRGRIYVAVPVRENGNGNGKAIIQTSFSDNQGLTWSNPITVSLATATQSFFPWITVDAATGFVYVVYYAFDQTTGFSTNTYVATSNDGGATFSNQKVSTVAHTTAPISGFSGGYEGDYIGIASYGWKAYPSWMDNRTGQWQDYVISLNNTPTITGPLAFCSTGTYTAGNLLPNSNITWNVTPTGIVNITPNGAQVTAAKLTQGNATLTATINNNPAASYSINITTIPQMSSITSTPGACNNGIQTWSISATPNMSNASNWNWTVDNPSSGIYIYNPNSPNTFMDVSGGGGVSVTYTDACGETSGRDGVTIYNQCPQFMASPNPATSTVTVSSMKPSSSTITEVNVYDFKGNLRKHQVFQGVTKSNIDVSNLPSGTYVIEIVDHAYRERQSLQIIK